MSPSEPSPPRPFLSDRRLGAVLFVAMVLVYHANTSVMDEGDAVPNVNLPIALIEHGKLSFSPSHFPELFKWHAKPPFAPTDDFYFRDWQNRFGDKSAAEWRDSGHLSFNGPRYNVVKSPKRDAYVSTFGPVPGIVSVPLMSLLHAIDPAIGHKFTLMLSVGKLQAALLVAGMTVLLFGIARRFVSRVRAVVVALVFGMGTCAWAISSQTLWQQTVSMFFLTLGAFFYLVEAPAPRHAVLSGLAFGAATACRPTSALVVALVALWLFLSNRRQAVLFAAACLPPLLLIAAYNVHFFGSPFSFGQELVGHQVAREKTGSRSLWQTPFWLGAAGLLVSPSRGLLVFSPVLGLSLWGGVRAFRMPAFARLRPLALGAVGMMAIQCKWFDWWGGWAYGYRPWVDALPFVTLLLVPVVDPIWNSPVKRYGAAVLLAWSVFVQGLGAFSYDRSWNYRRLFVVRVPTQRAPLGFITEEKAREFARRHGGTFHGDTLCNIDTRACRHRLWSLEDNLIHYQLTNFSFTRSRRFPPGWSTLGVDPQG